MSLRVIHRPVARILGSCLAVAIAVGSGSHAAAREFVQQINQAVRSIPEDKRSDRVLLPLWAEMELPTTFNGASIFEIVDPDPGRVVGTPVGLLIVALTTPDAFRWSELEAWSQRPAQRAVLDAIPSLTRETDFRQAMAFAQPYGVEGVPIEYIAKGLFTDLGEPPTISAAVIGYLPYFEATMMLVHAEATRLAASGQPDDAIDLLASWALLARQFADRAFFREATSAYLAMYLAFNHIRDVAYSDFRSERPRSNPSRLQTVISRLEPTGPIGLDRMRFPSADLLGCEQLLRRVMLVQGGPDPDRFATELARVTSRDRPLRLFSEAAFWDSIRTVHADRFDSIRMITHVRNDWRTRWDLRAFDPVMYLDSDFKRRVQSNIRYAGIQRVIPNMDGTFRFRQVLRTELAGTRMALALYAFYRQQNAMAPSVVSPRPSIIERVDTDPLQREGRNLEYFRVRDVPLQPRETERVHTVRVWLQPPPLETYTVPLDQSQWVLYSVGFDERRGSVQNAVNYALDLSGDYLLWPPAPSLLRQRLRDLGMLNAPLFGN